MKKIPKKSNKRYVINVQVEEIVLNTGPNKTKLQTLQLYLIRIQKR